MSAAAALTRVKVEEAFRPAIWPFNSVDWQRNVYYKTQEDYILGNAEAMPKEYRFM